MPMPMPNPTTPPGTLLKPRVETSWASDPEEIYVTTGPYEPNVSIGMRILKFHHSWGTHGRVSTDARRYDGMEVVVDDHAR